MVKQPQTWEKISSRPAKYKGPVQIFAQLLDQKGAASQHNPLGYKSVPFWASDMASLGEVPLEVALKHAFGEGGPLNGVKIGQLHFSKLMLGICGKLERIKAHHQEELNVLQKGWDEEKNELLARIAAEPTTASQVAPRNDSCNGMRVEKDLATLMALQAQVVDLRTQMEARYASQDEAVSSIQVVAASGARAGCPSCRSVRGVCATWRSLHGVGVSETVASLASMDVQDREALLAILDLEKGAPSAGPHETALDGELTAEGLLQRMTDGAGDGIKLRNEATGSGATGKGVTGDGATGNSARETPRAGRETERVLAVSSGGSDEELERMVGSSDDEDGLDAAVHAKRADVAALSELLDQEAEALNLQLAAETGVVGAPERSDWAAEAREAQRQRTDWEARAKSSKAKPAGGKPSSEPPRLPSRLGRLPVKTARYSDDEYDPAPARKRAKPAPTDEPTSMPPLTPSPTWKINAQLGWQQNGKGVPGLPVPSPRTVTKSSEGTGLPAPRVTRTLGGANAERELDVFCKPKYGTDGPRFEGKLRIWMAGEVVVFCRCPACIEEHGSDGLGMSPVEFEVHAGRGATKKWRHSIWVSVPQSNGKGPPVETTIEKCEQLDGGKHLTPVGLSAPGTPAPKATLPPAIQRHADLQVQCKSCGKWRRFRRQIASDFVRTTAAAADPDWKCADHYDPSVASCHIPEERSSRNRRPGCEACYFSELGCAKCRECTGCQYCRPTDNPEVEILE